ncbi:hypothetical protein BDV34DRAFT_113189 [Aspergillus parasiticus]|uniref:Uncharacterized protein n=1 Tax=Aspergillus parasiticus TaxID=5067 RepID=A0A5N6DHX8_ASPPA|nr:hypothetical protein BDV34DRAFT_113189 [Aspergillus parasiticus]
MMRSYEITPPLLWLGTCSCDSVPTNNQTCGISDPLGLHHTLTPWVTLERLQTPDPLITGLAPMVMGAWTLGHCTTKTKW